MATPARYPDTRPRLLAQLAMGKQTAAEIAERACLLEHSVRNHLVDLRVAGIAIDTGERRRKPGCRPVIVWELAACAVDVLQPDLDPVSTAMAHRLLEEARALALRLPLVEPRRLELVL